MGSFIVFVAFIATIYFAIKFFKFRKIKSNDLAITTKKRNYRNGLIISIVIMFVASIMTNPSEAPQKKSADSESVKVVKKTKYVDKDKYNIAKKENVALVAKKSKLSKQEKKLQEQRDKIEADEAKAKQQEQEEAQKQQEQQAKAEKEQQEKQAQSQDQGQSSSTQSQGDMNTSNTGEIVGNSKSHIYHVPGQRGYNMNSSNAVYFNNEQDAINAGYRRSKV
ncbi:DNA-entry nuclease [Companilactobacillus musae]|uniref:sunset domain-containing protein n=1 Tax=Companilactobacillus musae TaxID=1903258 RepID=UPI000E64BB1D|nr:DNA-entry nuclease [Companilactobacillus musae]